MKRNDAVKRREGAWVPVSCSDCSDQAARATDHGRRIFKTKPGVGPKGFVSVVCDRDKDSDRDRDSEGNAIGLHSLS